MLANRLPHNMGPKRCHKKGVLAFRMQKMVSEYRWRLRICETAVTNDRQGVLCYKVDWTQVNNKTE